MAGQSPTLGKQASVAAPQTRLPSTRTDEVCEVAAGFLSRHGVFQPGAHVVAAFSGGADSTALAIVLGRLGFRVTLAHVDHGMRAGSELDVFHCRAAARRLGMPIELSTVKVDPPSEAEARRVRYAALEGVRAELCADLIATGHTLNDDAETVEMRLRRGGFGLGIPPVRGRIIRPLLAAGRRDTEIVCRESGLLYLEDPSNQDMRFTRNQIRRELAPRDIERLARLGAHNLVLKRAADEQALQLSSSILAGRQPRLERRALLSAPGPVAKNLLRRALATAGVEEVSGRLLADILGKVVPIAGSSLDLPGGLAIWCEGASGGTTPESNGTGSGWVVVGRRRALEERTFPQVQLRLPGVTSVSAWGLCVAVSIQPREPGWNPVRPDRRDDSGEFIEIFDADALEGGLTLRQWRAGDRFFPLGLKTDRRGEMGPAAAEAGGRLPGEKKLQDFFVDAKVPRDGRRLIPLLASGDVIAWVVGHRIDERCKVTPQTRKVAKVRVSPLEASPP